MWVHIWWFNQRKLGEFHHQTDGGWNIWCFNQKICLGVNHQPWIPNLEVSWWFHWLRGGLKKCDLTMNEARRVLQHRQHELNSLFFKAGIGWKTVAEDELCWSMSIPIWWPFFETMSVSFLHFLQENPWLLKYSAAGLWLKTLWNDWNSEHGPGDQKCMGRYVCLLVWLCAWVSLF